MFILRDILYIALLAVVAPWLAFQSLRVGKYRSGWGQKLLGIIPKRPEGNRCVWFHAVSVGEIKVLEQIVTRFRDEHPDWTIAISTTTRTGMQVARGQYPECTLFYCPLDFSWAVRAAMRGMRPDLFVLAELEVWPNLLRAATRQGAKVALINGRLSDNSFRGYKRIGWALKSTFARFDYVGVQSDEYASRFVALGVASTAVSVTGSLKFDGINSDRDRPEFNQLRQLAGIEPSDRIWLAGSTQPEEDEIAVSVFSQLYRDWPDLRLILVPRHPERFDAAEAVIQRAGVPYLRRTRLDASRATQFESQIQTGTGDDGSKRWRVLLVDTIGELAAWWSSAEIAYVGGSMGRRGGQNMIEPAGFGAAVSFGPSTANFRDVVRLLLADDAAEVVQDAKELQHFVRKCLSQKDFVQSMGRRAKRLVERQQGASDATMKGLHSILEIGSKRQVSLSRSRASDSRAA